MIYVDRVRACVPNRHWRHSEACHLYALPGEEEAGELHSFAAGIGLKRRWFQAGGTMPHYDLTRAMRFKAAARGAVEVEDRQFVEHIKGWRSQRSFEPLWKRAEKYARLSAFFDRSLGEPWTEPAPYQQELLEVIEKKYLVLPGSVISRTDRQEHFVSARQLMRLYCVRPEECVVAEGERGRQLIRQWNHLEVLTPRYDGDYPLFQKPKPKANTQAQSNA